MAWHRSLRELPVHQALWRAGDRHPGQADQTYGWPDIEDTIRSYSVDAYADTESVMAKANSAFQKSKPDAAELGPLVADTLANYNFGQNLINAAARNANIAKPIFGKEDVQLAAGV